MSLLCVFSKGLRLVPAAALLLVALWCVAFVPRAAATSNLVELSPGPAWQPWLAVDLTANTGTTSAGVPSAIADDAFGQRIYSRHGNPGEVRETLPPSGGPSWTTWNLTGQAGAPRAGGDPAAYAVGGTSPRVYAVSDHGRLVEYNPDNLHGGIWSSYDLSTQAGVADLTGTPSVQRDAAGLMRVYARSNNGTLWEFVRTPGTANPWSATSLSAVAEPPASFPNDPATTMGAQYPEIFAVDARGNLVQIRADFRNGRTWHTHDITALTDSPKLQGRPAVVTDASGLRHVYARDRSGDLVEFVDNGTAQRPWGAYNLTVASNGAPKLAYDPSAVTVSGQPRVYATDVQGRVTEFAPDGASGRLWNFYNRSAGSGASVAGGLSAVSTSAGVRVYQGAYDPLLVDTQDPTFDLKGPLYEDRQHVLGAGTTRALTIEAKDTASEPQRGVQRIQVFVNDTLAWTHEQTQPHDDAALTGTWSPTPSTFDPGVNEVRVDVRDASRRVLSKSFSVTTTNVTDVVAPTVRADGELTDDELVVGGDRVGAILAFANDDSSGVKTLTLNRGTQELARIDVPCDVASSMTGTCPREEVTTLPFDAAALPTGKSTLTLTATDGAGNAATSSGWDVTVDRRAPNAVADIDGLYDDANGRTELAWDVPEDPAQADGSAGSGVESFRYRYNRTGTWSTWRTSEDLLEHLPGGAVGDSIRVEIAAVDRVGNSSPVVSRSLTVEEPREVEIRTSGEFYDPENGPSARRAGDVLVICKGTRSSPVRFGVGGQPGNAVRGYVTFTCGPGNANVESAEAALKVSMSYKVCVEWWRGGGSNVNELDCKKHKASGPRLAFGGDRGGAAELCRPGTATYRVAAVITRMRVTRRLELPATSIDPPAAGPSVDFPCNEAGAFRRLATRGSKTASAQLASSLNTSGADPTPDGAPGVTNGGWFPHHIVPAGEGNGEREAISDATRAQARAYSCNILPNEADNGVWLRGSKLREGTTAFADLRPQALQLRALHTTLHTNDYYATLNRRLAAHGSTTACGSFAGMRTELHALRFDLATARLDGRG